MVFCSIHSMVSGKLGLIYSRERKRRVEAIVLKPHLTSKYGH